MRLHLSTTGCDRLPAPFHTLLVVPSDGSGLGACGLSSDSSPGLLDGSTGPTVRPWCGTVLVTVSALAVSNLYSGVFVMQMGVGHFLLSHRQPQAGLRLHAVQRYGGLGILNVSIGVARRARDVLGHGGQVSGSGFLRRAAARPWAPALLPLGATPQGGGFLLT